jgi:hypothetical protein
MSLRDRLDMLSRGEVVGLVVVLVALLGGAGLWYVRSLPQPVTIAQVPAGAAEPAASASPTARGRSAGRACTSSRRAIA